MEFFTSFFVFSFRIYFFFTIGVYKLLKYGSSKLKKGILSLNLQLNLYALTILIKERISPK